MSALALAFMIGSWSFVLGLTAWCFRRVLRADRHRPPDHGSVAPSPPEAAGRSDEP